MNELSKVRRALISVSDKHGVVEFAKRLQRLDIQILSTGGTAKLLSENGILVTEISTYTGFPELMEGRLKTLHPKVHGGLLGRRGIDDATMESHDIPPIDLVVVNLYPFEQTVADPSRELADAIENIDIGGPTMLRAAAKNYDAVTVLVDKADYGDIALELETQNGCTTRECRFRLALKVFEHTARYDGAIANYLGRIRPAAQPAPFAHTFNMQFHLAQEMRYGENPHQKAAFYAEERPPEDSVAGARQIQGKALSYNNVADADAALECAKQFAAPACVIVKHANPCGVATAESLETAYDTAFQTDPTSAFGGVIAFNRLLDEATARLIIERQFVEVLIAPGVNDDALKALASKENVRVLACAPWPDRRPPAFDCKRVAGGLLVQSRDIDIVETADLNLVTRRAPTATELDDLQFAWRVAKFVKSNAIVYARDHGTVGIGAGQMSRVYSAKIAGIKASDEGIPVAGSVMASDAFFPFRDGIDTAAAEGITAVIQPGGSMRDAEVIDAANEHGMAMVFTGMRHFRH